VRGPDPLGQGHRLRNLPLKGYAQNQLWCEIVAHPARQPGNPAWPVSETHSQPNTSGQQITGAKDQVSARNSMGPLNK
jgi:hypothetical protein